MFQCLPDLSGLSVLDLGCGAGYYSHLALSRGAAKVYAVDFSPKMISTIKHPNIHTILADCALVDAGKMFQCMIVAGLLEFVPRPLDILRNSRLMAEKDCQLGLLVPEKNHLSKLYASYHRRNGLEINCFGVSEIEALAEGSGWVVSKQLYVWPFTSVYCLRAV